ncbi:MAG: response regulator transcription factor [Deltaproteobacteria bacterium]|nr:response regulator transcription factor [Deltaproteobacteria bacterium]
MTLLRVAIADDHVVLRVGLRAFLEEQTDPQIDIVGEASDGDGAVALVTEKRPDVLILDLSMPGLGGLGTVIELRRQRVRTRILVLTQHAEEVYLRRALEAGANGYLLKTARGEELLSALRAVASGGTYVDPGLAGALLPGRRSEEPVPANDEEMLHLLTPREQQVLGLVAEGLSNKEIAASLGVAVKTAMAHRANMMEKLSIHNRSKLVQFAIRVGLLTLDPHSD